MPTTNPVYTLVKNYLRVVQQKLPADTFTRQISDKTTKETSSAYYFLPLINVSLPCNTGIPSITWTEHHFSIFEDSDKAHGNSLYHYTLTGLHQGKPVCFHVYFNKAGNMVEVKKGKDSHVDFAQLGKSDQTQITEFATQASTQLLHTVSTIRQEEIARLQTQFDHEEQGLAALVKQSQTTSLTKSDKNTLVSKLNEKSKQCKTLLQSLAAIAESADHFTAQANCIAKIVKQAKSKLHTEDDTLRATRPSHIPELQAIPPVQSSHTIVDDIPTVDTTAERLTAITATITALESIKNIQKKPTHFKQLHDLYLEAIELTNDQDFNAQLQLFRKLNQLPKMATTVFKIHVHNKDVAQAQEFITHLSPLPFPVLVKAIVTAIDNDDADMLTMLHQQTHFPVDYILLDRDTARGYEGQRFKERAAQEGKYKALTTLLTLGANPNAPVYGLYMSFAGWLATQGHIEALRIAYNFGADLNYIYSSRKAQQATKTKLGNSGPHNALVRRQHSALQQCNGIQAIDHGHSILSLAALQGQFMACLVLLELGAKKKHNNNLGNSQLSSVCNAITLILPHLLIPLPGSVAQDYKKNMPCKILLLDGKDITRSYTLSESITQLMAAIELSYQLSLPLDDKHGDKAKAIFNMASILNMLYAVHTDAPMLSAKQCIELNEQAQGIRAQLDAIPELEDAEMISAMIAPILQQPFAVIKAEKPVIINQLPPRNSFISTTHFTDTPVTPCSVQANTRDKNPTHSTNAKSKPLMLGTNRSSFFSCNTCVRATIATVAVVSTLIAAAALTRS